MTTFVMMKNNLLIRKRLLPVILMIILAGCNFFRAPGKDRCEKIISKEKMTDLLTDVYILEGFLQEVKVTSPNLNDTIMHYYGGLFEKHEVTMWEFKEALSCYLLHEREIQMIHDEVLQRLSILESEIIAKAEETEEFEPYVWIRSDETEATATREGFINSWQQTVPAELFEAQEEVEGVRLESEEALQ